MEKPGKLDIGKLGSFQQPEKEEDQETVRPTQVRKLQINQFEANLRKNEEERQQQILQQKKMELEMESKEMKSMILTTMYGDDDEEVSLKNTRSRKR